jgi:hypothetical protein
MILLVQRWITLLVSYGYSVVVRMFEWRPSQTNVSRWTYRILYSLLTVVIWNSRDADQFRMSVKNHGTRHGHDTASRKSSQPIIQFIHSFIDWLFDLFFLDHEDVLKQTPYDSVFVRYEARFHKQCFLHWLSRVGINWLSPACSPAFKHCSGLCLYCNLYTITQYQNDELQDPVWLNYSAIC